jgi:hypothetical protein
VIRPANLIVARHVGALRVLADGSVDELADDVGLPGMALRVRDDMHQDPVQGDLIVR